MKSFIRLSPTLGNVLWEILAIQCQLKRIAIKREMEWNNRLYARLIQVYSNATDTLSVSISIAINFGVLIELIFHRYVNFMSSSTVSSTNPFFMNGIVSMHALT